MDIKDWDALTWHWTNCWYNIYTIGIIYRCIIEFLLQNQICVNESIIEGRGLSSAFAFVILWKLYSLQTTISSNNRIRKHEINTDASLHWVAKRHQFMFMGSNTFATWSWIYKKRSCHQHWTWGFWKFDCELHCKNYQVAVYWKWSKPDIWPVNQYENQQNAKTSGEMVTFL